MTAERPWYWEGNVQRALVDHLSGWGYTILRHADTARKEHGADIIARGEGIILHVEVKGYPLARRKTTPNNRARQLYAQAMYAAMRLYEVRTYGVDNRVALAFPDKDTYTRLIHKTNHALARLGVGVFIIGRDGNVWVMRDY